MSISILLSGVWATNVVSNYSPDEINTFYDKIKSDSDFQQKLKNFQEQELATLVSQTTLSDENIQERQKEIGGIYGELEKIQQQFDTIGNQKKFLDSKIGETKQSIQIVIDQAKKTQKETDEILKQVSEYNNKINSAKVEISQTNKDKERARAMASKFIDILYKLTNELYSADNEIDDFKLFMKSENISTDLSNNELIQMTSMRYGQLIVFIDEKQVKLKKLLSTLEESQLKYKSKLNEYQRKLEILNQQKEYLIEYIQIYNSSKDGLITKEADLQKSKTQLLKDLQEKIAESTRFIAWNNYLKQKLASGESNLDDERYFSWPIYPVEKIQAAYNSVDYIKKYSETNQWIDIITPQWTEVYAPADWYIYDVVAPKWVSLGYIIIIHNYGFASLLTTLSDVIVKQGQYISRWQLLGISWGEPGTKWAWFLSPWPRLHREIYKDSTPISLFEHTDLSSVKNTNTLPTQFNIKNLKDKVARNIDLSSVSYIQWATLEDRIKNFINKYGNAPFDSYTLWQQASKDHKIPLELWVCIAVAETSFGKAYASAWNVGNVGNNDRGDRVDFSWPVEGAWVIYYALENQYLWGYPTLNKLSGYGNTVGAIYASSPINRQNNIVKCLTEIHGFRIPDDRPVRLYKAN